MKIIKKENLYLYIPLLILSIISLFNMVNAKLINNIYQDAFFKQLIWFTMGYLLLIILPHLNLKRIFKYAKYFYYLAIILLILVLFLGDEVNGAKCWLSFKGISFQPSELAKLSLSLYLVAASQVKLKGFKDELYIIIKLFFITLIPSILVFLEPDTGAIINYLIIYLIIILSLKLNKWWYITVSLIAAFGLTSFFLGYFFNRELLIKLIGTSIMYRMDRLINFANGNSYQLTQALVTIGSASFWGLGLNKILLYIPEAPTDFFFAFSIGNYGIFSGILIIILFSLLSLYLMIKLDQVKVPKVKLFGYTYLGIFLFQTIYNIGMNLGMLPIMGIPLPFLSYGGTNTIINFLYLGLIINLWHEKRV